jgi:hypothetical protein
VLPLEVPAPGFEPPPEAPPEAPAVLEVFELSLEELLEPGVQPMVKRRRAPARTGDTSL